MYFDFDDIIVCLLWYCVGFVEFVFDFDDIVDILVIVQWVVMVLIVILVFVELLCNVLLVFGMVILEVSDNIWLELLFDKLFLFWICFDDGMLVLLDQLVYLGC